MTPLKGAINHPGVGQVARIARCREPLKTDAGAGDGKDRIETDCPVTSLDAKAASPGDPLRPTAAIGQWKT